MSDCLFCKMISGEISVEKVFENDEFICIKDIRPQAKIHLLVFPKLHSASLVTLPENLGGKMLSVVSQIATSMKILKSGFRTVINTGPDSGQTIFHVHAHILAGEPLDGFGRARF